MRKLILNLFLSVAFAALAAPDYYLAGEFNGWQPNQEAYKFSQSDDIYTLTLSQLQGEFKITTSAWEHQYGAGATADGQALESGKTYKCVESGNGYNMTLADQSARDITLTFDNKNKTISVSGGSPSLYLVGDFNNWQKSEVYLFAKSGDKYILRTSNFKGEFRIVSHDDTYSFGRSVNPELNEGDEYLLDNNGGKLYFGGLSDPNGRLRITVNPNGKESTNGIETGIICSQPEGPVEYFTLQGVRVPAPERGVYIRRIGLRTEKIVIR